MFNHITRSQVDCFDQKFQSINECEACNNNLPCSYSKVYDKKVTKFLDNIITDNMVKHLFSSNDRDFIKNLDKKSCYNKVNIQITHKLLLLKRLFENYLFPNGELNQLLPYSIDPLFGVEWKNGYLRVFLTKEIKVASNAPEIIPLNLYIYIVMNLSL